MAGSSRPLNYTLNVATVRHEGTHLSARCCHQGTRGPDKETDLCKHTLQPGATQDGAKEPDTEEGGAPTSLMEPAKASLRRRLGFRLEKACALNLVSALMH